MACSNNTIKQFLKKVNIFTQKNVASRRKCFLRSAKTIFCRYHEKYAETFLGRPRKTFSHDPTFGSQSNQLEGAKIGFILYTLQLSVQNRFPLMTKIIFAARTKSFLRSAKSSSSFQQQFFNELLFFSFLFVAIKVTIKRKYAAETAAERTVFCKQSLIDNSETFFMASF